VTVKAGIYARISKDDGSALGVGRQVEDCEREAARRGWTVAECYVDNDVSATRSKTRPAYDRLLADIRANRIDALMVWDVDRLTRNPRELEDVIDLSDAHGLKLANVGGEIDLSTPQGQLTARIKGSVARHEADQTSRRMKRKLDERAANGLPHSFPAFGYRRQTVRDEYGRIIESRDVIDPAEAAVIRDTARRLLLGESLRAIVADLNKAGSASPRGIPWSSATLRQVMLRDRNAGLRRHRGQVVGRGAWEPVYSEDTHNRVTALLTDPGRRTNKGSVRKHLLSGLARCGRCGAGMRVQAAWSDPRTGRTSKPSYACGGCLRVRRLEVDVDAVVEGVMIARLQQPDAIAALAQGDPERVSQARGAIEAHEAKLALAADEFADGALTADQLRRITGKLRPQIEREKAAVAAHSPNPGALDLAGPDAEALWRAAPLEIRRAIIEAFATVVIMPSGSGRSFDPQSVIIEWRT
jgi:site-specific DNA recombinase